MSVHSPLSYSSFHLSLQQNSITLTLPYNHFSSLRLDSFPGQTEKSLITLWPWLTPFHLLWFPLSRRHPRWTSPSLYVSLSLALPPHLHFTTCEHLFKRDNPQATCPNLHLWRATPACEVISCKAPGTLCPLQPHTHPPLTSFDFIPQKQTLSQ